MKNLLVALVLAVFCSCSTSCSTLNATSVAPATEAVAQAGIVPHIILSTEIDDNTAQQAIAAFDAADMMKVKTVLFEINSPGGSVDAGFLIAKAIENSNANVICVVDAMAASMAFYILQSCDIRVMTDRSLLMAHEPAIRAGIGGKSEDWRKQGNGIADLLEALTKSMNHHMARRLTISYEEFSKRIHNTEYWMTAEEALKISAVDQVVASVKEVKEILSQ